MTTTHPNGAALAAFLAAGIGAFATGFFVVLHEAGVLPAPSLYAPAGALSGRIAFACATWLLAWAVLHARWRGRRVEARRPLALTAVLIVLGLIGTYPPVWALFE